MLFAALILPSSDELSIFTFPGDFLKSVQTQQSDWKIKRSFAQVRMFMSRDKIFNYFASFQHISKTGWIQLISSARQVGFSTFHQQDRLDSAHFISKTGWIQLIKHQQLNIVLLTDHLRQREALHRLDFVCISITRGMILLLHRLCTVANHQAAQIQSLACKCSQLHFWGGQTNMARYYLQGSSIS